MDPTAKFRARYRAFLADCERAIADLKPFARDYERIRTFLDRESAQVAAIAHNPRLALLEPVPKSARRAPLPAHAERPRGPLTRQAEWLAQQMQLADHVTPNGLEALGGPDGKTTKRILQGLGSSRDDVYHKLIESLNEANRRARRNVVLTIRDIPQD